MWEYDIARQKDLSYDKRFAFRVRPGRTFQNPRVREGQPWDKWGPWATYEEETCPKPRPSTPRNVNVCPEDHPTLYSRSLSTNINCDGGLARRYSAQNADGSVAAYGYGLICLREGANNNALRFHVEKRHPQRTVRWSIASDRPWLTFAEPLADGTSPGTRTLRGDVSGRHESIAHVIADAHFSAGWRDLIPDGGTETATVTVRNETDGETVYTATVAVDFDDRAGLYIDEDAAPGEPGTRDPGAVEHTAPLSHAGADRTAAPGERVTLDGGVENPVQGAEYTYAWVQAGGPAVILDDAGTASASFTVPADAAAGAALIFDLTVADRTGDGTTDSVTVTVRAQAQPTVSVSPCSVELGTLSAGAAAARSDERWDNPQCRAHHRADARARYFRFSLGAPAAVSADLDTQSAAALFVSKGTPQNGWGAVPRATYAHRIGVRRANGKLVHEEAPKARLALGAGTYTVEVVAGAPADGAGHFDVTVSAAALSAVSVADARGEEGEDARIAFAVTLDAPSLVPVTVAWATADGTARAGEDYAAASGRLSFAPGETAKAVEVAILDDAHDEGEETFGLTLSDPEGVTLGDAEAVGTIGNSDPLLAAWLARFGRTVASQTVDALTERFAAPSGAGSHVTLGGQRIGLDGLGTAPDGVASSGPGQAPEPGARQVLTALAAADGQAVDGTGTGVIPGSPGTAESRSMTGRDLLLGSAFHLSAGGDDGAGPRWTGWGRAALERFENTDGGLPVDGEVVTGVFGADWERGRWLAGVALSHSMGEGAMRPRGMAMEYDMESTLTAVHPYVRMKLSDRVSAWGLVGYGRGDLTVTQKLDEDGDSGTGRTTYETDIAMTLGALGARGALLTPEEADGFGLALKGDAFLVRTTSDRIDGVEGLGNLAAADADASRVRLVLEGSREMALGEGSGTLTPSLEIGARHDGGDAETGMGLEIGGGVRYADPASGLSMDLKARGLLAHEESGYREWGVSGSIGLAPGASGRGLSLSLTPAYGADAGSADRLWTARDAAALAADGNADPAARMEAEVGYGLAAFDGGFTGTPYAGFGYSDTERRYRLGWRLAPAAAGAGAFQFSLEASRRETANDHAPAEHGIGFRATARW